MSERDIRVELFAEDGAHEAFVTAMVSRIARDLGIAVEVLPRWARGGHGRALDELRTFQRIRKARSANESDVLVVLIDANSAGWAARHKAVLEIVDETFWPRVVIGCPDPHIERWLMADPTTFAQVVGSTPAVASQKFERGRYKRILIDAVIAGGNVPVLGGVEFARDLVDAMDLFRAGKTDSSLANFLKDLQIAMKQASAIE